MAVAVVFFILLPAENGRLDFLGSGGALSGFSFSFPNHLSVLYLICFSVVCVVYVCVCVFISTFKCPEQCANAPNP